MNQSKCQLIEITSSEARHLVGSKDGRSWDFWLQQAFATTGEAYPQPFDLRIPEGAKPYEPGFYFLAAGCIRVGKAGTIFQQGYGLVPVSEALVELQGAAAASPSSGRASAALRAAS